jgi:hypothetical protein
VWRKKHWVQCAALKLLGEPLIPAMQSCELTQEIPGKIVAQVSSFVISILYVGNVIVR